MPALPVRPSGVPGGAEPGGAWRRVPAASAGIFSGRLLGPGHAPDGPGRAADGSGRAADGAGFDGTSLFISTGGTTIYGYSIGGGSFSCSP